MRYVSHALALVVGLVAGAVGMHLLSFEEPVVCPEQVPVVVDQEAPSVPPVVEAVPVSP